MHGDDTHSMDVCHTRSGYWKDVDFPEFLSAWEFQSLRHPG